MCGFLGWFRNPGIPWDVAARSRQARALEMITHRGPDDGHEALGDGWWMGFRRLSILDLTEAGRQPMRFHDGKRHLAFNGEIYNFKELRRAHGCGEQSSTGDTAVLGAMLDSLPVESVLSDLRGMFAFAWWNEERRELVAARDPFGIKPLYYRTGEHGDLWLGSELRAVRALSAHEGKASWRALAQYFRWGAVQAPDTFFDGIQCLPPGHLLRWREGRVEITRYHTPAWPDQSEWITDAAMQREMVREIVLKSIEAHLVSDVPVGVFLSGGLDSTIMAAGMRHLGQKKVQAFSIGYELDSGVPDESDTAERTAQHLGCQFTSERLNAESLESKLDGYFRHLDQPTGDALNTYLVSSLAARSVKVTLSGLGADEWFAGYNYHRLVMLAAQSPLARSAIGRVSGAALRLAETFLPERLRGHPAWKAASYACGGRGGAPMEWHARSRTLLEPHHIAMLLGVTESAIHVSTTSGDLRESLGRDLPARGPGSWLREYLLIETETYLANTLLRDNDVTSMAHSLELRVPLVDREVFALAGRLPPDSLIHFDGGKRVLREAFRDLLPEWIYEDRQKKTFTLPLMKWMRHPRWRERIHDTLTSTRSRQRDWVRPESVTWLMDRYFKSTASGKTSFALSQPVWMLFVLESWAREHLDGPAA
jgi:asparagine synthase (glutamine-hydrolysing)